MNASAFFSGNVTTGHCRSHLLVWHPRDVPGIALEERADFLEHDEILPASKIARSYVLVVELEQVQFGLPRDPNRMLFALQQSSFGPIPLRWGIEFTPEGRRK